MTRMPSAEVQLLARQERLQLRTLRRAVGRGQRATGVPGDGAPASAPSSLCLAVAAEALGRSPWKGAYAKALRRMRRRITAPVWRQLSVAPPRGGLRRHGNAGRGCGTERVCPRRHRSQRVGECYKALTSRHLMRNKGRAVVIAQDNQPRVR